MPLPSFSGADKKHNYSAHQRIKAQHERLEYSDKAFYAATSRLRSALNKILSAENEINSGIKMITSAKNNQDLDVSGLSKIPSIINENKADIKDGIDALTESKATIDYWSKGTNDIWDFLDLLVDKAPKKILGTAAMGAVSAARGLVSMFEFIPGVKSGNDQLFESFYSGDIGKLVEGNSIFYKNRTISSGISAIGEALGWVAVGEVLATTKIASVGGKIVTKSGASLLKPITSSFGLGKDTINYFYDLREKGYKRAEALKYALQYVGFKGGAEVLGEAIPSVGAADLAGKTIIKASKSTIKDAMEQQYMESADKERDYQKKVNTVYSKDEYLIQKAQDMKNNEQKKQNNNSKINKETTVTFNGFTGVPKNKLINQGIERSDYFQ